MKKPITQTALELACLQIARKCSNCPVDDGTCFSRASISCADLIHAHFKKAARNARRRKK